MKNIFKISFTFLLSAMLWSSCTSENEEELFPAAATVSLENDVQPIISAGCAVSGCHVSGAQSPNLSTKEGTFAKRDRVNVRAVINQNMPPSGALSQTDRDVIETWISEGGKIN